MNALSNLREKLNRSKRYRESFPAAVVKRMLPLQVRVLRRQRGWSQAQLAKESNLTQGVISRAEDPDYGNLTVNTLVRLAAGFDCAFIGRFVPFSELGKWYTNVTDEKLLEVPSFAQDQGFQTTLLNTLSGASAAELYRFGLPNTVLERWSLATLATTPNSIQAKFIAPRKGPNIEGHTPLTTADAMLYAPPSVVSECIAQ
jgi:transcriptional regulator with XRE-family HTH domain